MKKLTMGLVAALIATPAFADTTNCELTEKLFEVNRDWVNELGPELEDEKAKNQQLQSTISQARIELQIAHDKLYTYINQPYGEKDYDLVLDATLEIQSILNDLGGHIDPGNLQP